MMGKNHLVTGACALEHAYAAGRLIDMTGNPYLQSAKQFICSNMGLTDTSVYMLPICIGAYVMGCLLPDIDSPDSLFGRMFRVPIEMFHVPIKHRRWLHAIYAYLAVAMLGLVHPAFYWMFLGVCVHLFWDSLSAAGNCWFYKLFSDYKEYDSGAFIKKGHWLKLYHAGEWSEYLLVSVIVAVTVASFVWIRRV